MYKFLGLAFLTQCYFLEGLGEAYVSVVPSFSLLSMWVTRSLTLHLLK